MIYKFKSSNETYLSDNSGLVTYQLSILDLPDKSPLSQEDLDKYTKLIPETALFTNKLFSGTITNNQLANKILKSYNIDLYRFYFVRLKIFLYLSIVIHNIQPDFSKIHSSLIPTFREIELIEKNKEAILEAHEKYRANKENHG
ncbi:MAG: hypothetical protein LBE80_08060 [Deltaproteobacteria bacterium]|jgi:hypothetical protein|nr:hypothetical protein [Deltaproteobacteria bacterium]